MFPVYHPLRHYCNGLPTLFLDRRYWTGQKKGRKTQHFDAQGSFCFNKSVWQEPFSFFLLLIPSPRFAEYEIVYSRIPSLECILGGKIYFLIFLSFSLFLSFFLSLSLFLSLSFSLSFSLSLSHTHTHTISLYSLYHSISQSLSFLLLLLLLLLSPDPLVPPPPSLFQI